MDIWQIKALLIAKSIFIYADLAENNLSGSFLLKNLVVINGQDVFRNGSVGWIPK
jgi:hypothetical protein